ncbi:hypothetical protein SERLA73DRAFT_81423, partial [Serpula lacrymans var. lacrymans S7.3]
SAFAAVDVNLLHRRMGHIGMDRLQRMVTKRQLQDIDTLTGTPEFCEPCALGKMKKLPFKSTGGKPSQAPPYKLCTQMLEDQSNQLPGKVFGTGLSL